MLIIMILKTIGAVDISGLRDLQANINQRVPVLSATMRDGWGALPCFPKRELDLSDVKPV